MYIYTTQAARKYNGILRTVGRDSGVLDKNKFDETIWSI
jgi:hypothetical protein